MPSFKMKFLGVTILQGVEFSIFPIDFEWALQQYSATALPVMVPRAMVTEYCNPIIFTTPKQHNILKRRREIIKTHFSLTAFTDPDRFS